MSKITCSCLLTMTACIEGQGGAPRPTFTFLPGSPGFMNFCGLIAAMIACNKSARRHTHSLFNMPCDLLQLPPSEVIAILKHAQADTVKLSLQLQSSSRDYMAHPMTASSGTAMCYFMTGTMTGGLSKNLTRYSLPFVQLQIMLKCHAAVMHHVHGMLAWLRRTRSTLALPAAYFHS